MYNRQKRPGQLREAGVNISLHLPARAGEQFQKIGISGEEFLKFSCKMLHFVDTQRRKDELNEQILKILLRVLYFVMRLRNKFRF